MVCCWLSTDVLCFFHNAYHTTSLSSYLNRSGVVTVMKMIMKASLALYYLVGGALAKTNSLYRESKCPESQTCLPLSQCDDEAVGKLLQSIQASTEVEKMFTFFFFYKFLTFTDIDKVKSIGCRCRL